MAGETNTRKKSRWPRNSEVDGDGDLLSKLPDSVLCHVLSCLPTETAIRTSVLSREWEYKRTNIYRLNLDDRIFSCRRYFGKRIMKKKADFATFVDRVLLLCRNVKQFSLSCGSTYDLSRVKTWIAAVLMSKALEHAELQSSLPIFGRLTHLKVHSNRCANKYIRLLMELLKREPALEKLMFALVPRRYHSEKINLELTKFTFHHLKVVEFEECSFLKCRNW